jgi:accessory colonization factor AcfC
MATLAEASAKRGNPRGIRRLADLLRIGTRIAVPDSGDVRAQCFAAVEAQLATLSPQRRRIFPVASASCIAIWPNSRSWLRGRRLHPWYHLVSFWARASPDHFARERVGGELPLPPRFIRARHAGWK